MAPRKIKELPHNDEAEQAALGSILIAQKEQDLILDQLTESDFFNPIHRIIFTTIREMRATRRPVDLLTVTAELESTGQLENCGGPSYTTCLFTMVPSPANAPYYVEIIKDKAMMRDLIERSEKTIKYAHGEGEYFKADYILDHAKQEFCKIERWRRDPPLTLADHAEAKMQRMETGEPGHDTIRTGIAELDRISPLRRGDLPIIKAQRKTGKSTLGLSILENICIRDSLPGVIFSLEDRTAKVVDRIFAGIARIPSNKTHIKQLSPEEVTAASKAIAKIAAANIQIFDDVFDLSQILARARKSILEYPTLAVIVVDYAQLIRVEVRKSDTREREIATISRAFRLLAMETGVPIILISQVNSDGETRESRALEQDCTASWVLLEGEDEDPKTRVIKVEFQRNGESGVSFPVRFLGNIARVENFSGMTEK